MTPVPQMQNDALLGLAILKDPDSVPDLLDIAREPLQPDTREMVCMALNAVGEVSPLVTALGDPNPNVAEVAAEALGRIGSQEAVDALTTALDHKQVTVRMIAARSLGDHRRRQHAFGADKGAERRRGQGEDRGGPFPGPFGR